MTVEADDDGPHEIAAGTTTSDSSSGGRGGATSAAQASSGKTSPGGTESSAGGDVAAQGGATSATTSVESTETSGSYSSGAPSTTSGYTSGGGAGYGTTETTDATVTTVTTGFTTGSSTTGNTCELERLDGSLVDDMNDGDGFIPDVGGRTGSWSSTHDDTPEASMFPEPTEPFSMTDTGDSCRKMASRVFGGPYAVWGAAWGFGLGAPYDMSAFSGISFLAKIEAGSASVIRVSIETTDTNPWGGVCEGAQCGDNFGRRVTLSNKWQRYTLPFDALMQEGWGLQVGEFDPAKAFGVKFSVGAGAAFDVWIDDVWLVY